MKKTDKSGGHLPKRGNWKKKKTSQSGPSGPNGPTAS